MKKFLMAVCFSVLLLSPAWADEDKITTTLDISAEAHAKTVPDIATITAGVVTIAPRADEALVQNKGKMKELFEALKFLGIPEKDIQTSGFNLTPQYNHSTGTPVIQSYQVANNVTVIIHDMKLIGPVIDSIVAQGSNQISGPNFTTENTDTLLDDARREAVAKARKRAELYAQAAGLKIKRIVSINEQGGYIPQPQPMMMRAMMGAGGAMADVSTPVAAGELNVSLTVSMRFELTP